MTNSKHHSSASHVLFLGLHLLYARGAADGDAIDGAKDGIPRDDDAAGPISVANSLDATARSLHAESMDNPATSNCVGRGYAHQILWDPTGGQYCLCVFGDGTACEEWAYYQGRCDSTNPNFAAYCMDREGQISNASVDWGDVEGAAADAEYLVCTVDGIECTNDDYYTNGGCASFESGICLTEDDCHERAVEMDLPFYSGTYETKGCFKKEHMVLFSLGTVNEMADPGPLEDERERVYCDEETAGITGTSAPVTTTTESPTYSPIESSDSPTKSPVTKSPTTESPITDSPTKSPVTKSPTTESPTSDSPTKAPVTDSPTESPSGSPTKSPITKSPTTESPVTDSPTMIESLTTEDPTISPTCDPGHMTEDSLSMSMSHSVDDPGHQTMPEDSLSMSMSHSMPAGEDTSAEMDVDTELVSVSPPSPEGTSVPVSGSQSEDSLTSMSLSMPGPAPVANGSPSAAWSWNSGDGGGSGSGSGSGSGDLSGGSTGTSGKSGKAFGGKSGKGSKSKGGKGSTDEWMHSQLKSYTLITSNSGVVRTIMVQIVAAIVGSAAVLLL